MRDAGEPDPMVRDGDLMAVGDLLLDCQKILDRYRLFGISAHVDMALCELRNHVPVPENSLAALMDEFGLDDLPAPRPQTIRIILPTKHRG